MLRRLRPPPGLWVPSLSRFRSSRLDPRPVFSIAHPTRRAGEKALSRGRILRISEPVASCACRSRTARAARPVPPELRAVRPRSISNRGTVLRSEAAESAGRAAGPRSRTDPQNCTRIPGTSGAVRRFGARTPSDDESPSRSDRGIAPVQVGALSNRDHSTLTLRKAAGIIDGKLKY